VNNLLKIITRRKSEPSTYSSRSRHANHSATSPFIAVRAAERHCHSPSLTSKQPAVSRRGQGLQRLKKRRLANIPTSFRASKFLHLPLRPPECGVWGEHALGQSQHEHRVHLSAIVDDRETWQCLVCYCEQSRRTHRIQHVTLL